MQKHEITYDRQKVTPGILHFGVGNFHRAHQQYYTHLLLADADQQAWGICGAMILERDESLFRKLTEQKGRYGLTVFGRTGEDEHYQIGSLVELLWGVQDPAAIINKAADPQIKIISLTITEGGYNLDKKTGEFDFANADIQHDLLLTEQPRTVFGYITAGLRKRILDQAGPITILSCDNLPHNGDVCRSSFLAFFKQADEAVYRWALENVSFPNTMVDRITPATLPEDIEKLQSINGFEDQAPVYCEDFVQWVIEDKFKAGRPQWERVGAEFTDNVAIYESMKLGFVNSTHSMLSFPAFFAGYRKVNDAVADERIATYLRQYMDLDVTPYLTPPPRTDFEVYKQIVMERLGNQTVSDQLSRLCFDAGNKIPMFMAHTFNAMLVHGVDLKRIAFFVAVYRQYLRSTVDEKGVAYQIVDPALTEEDFALARSEEPLDFLGASCFTKISLAASKSFGEVYTRMCLDVAEQGVLKTLEDLIV